jgi:hypothetical protein
MSDIPDALSDLHDATLASIEFEWGERRCTLRFHGAPERGLQRPFSIAFEGVTEVNIPAERPWGPSQAVLEVDCVEPGNYVLVMQSGDEIWIAAESEPVRFAADA